MPEPGATQVPLDIEIEVEFSERVVRSSVEEVVFLTPEPEGGYELKWKGRQLRVRPRQPLQPGRTYVLTIGAGARDLRNNVMRESFSLAFSTGREIDRGAIAGRVFDGGRPAQGVLVSAYDLDVKPEPDPSRDAAMYFTQTGSDGAFKLLYLRPSRYRVFVWRDRDANRRWSPGEEEIGLPWRDSVVTNDSTTTMEFWLAALDTTGPRIVDARSYDRLHAVVRTSERIDSAKSSLDWNITPASGSGAEVIVYRDDRFGDRFHLASREPLPAQFTFSLRGLADVWGNRTVEDTIVVRVSDRPDTSRPLVERSMPPDSARDVLPVATIDVWFSEAVDTGAAKGAVTLRLEDSTSVPCRISWPTPAHVHLVPDQALAGNRAYALVLEGGRIVDFAGNALADSAIVIRFWTLTEDTLTEIWGRVIDPLPDAVGPIRVRALRASDAKVQAETEAAEDGSYRLSNLLPGPYLLVAYRDSDEDGRLSPGWPRPFRPAERFAVYADTVRTRSRWINEGNDFHLPQ